LAKKEMSEFIDSVPEMVEKLRNFKKLTLSNPEIPFPWPPYVPTPDDLDRGIDYLQKLYEAIGDENIHTGGELGRARKKIKTRVSQLVRYVSLMMKGGYCDLERWPGFDLGRNPGEGRCRARYRSLPALVRIKQSD